MRTYNYPNIIPAGSVMNQTLDSKAMQLQNMFGYAIQVFFTGTPTGSFKLQASADYVGASSTYVPTNWTDVANSTFPVVAAGNVEWNSTSANYNYVRVVYTDTSGGTSTAVIASCTFNGKGF